MREVSAVKKGPKRKEQRSQCWISIAFVALLAAFCYSAYKLTDGMLAAKNEREAFAELSAIVAKNAPSSKEATSPQYSDASQNNKENKITPYYYEETRSDTAPVISPLPQYLPLYEMNNEFFGWLSVEGTVMDFPVMYSPNRPGYYLDHAFDGSDSRSGVPFIDGKCPADGSYYLVYGHHMRNKTMFGQLPNYSDQRFYKEHPIICFDTLYEQRKYQVVAAFFSRIYDKDEMEVFRYYEYTDLPNEEVFNEYMQQVYAAAIYDTGIKCAFGDELLALSTCNYHTENGRFVVVARRINNGEYVLKGKVSFMKHYHNNRGCR